jgi:hypothetical protein
LLTPIDVVAVLRDYEFLVDRAKSEEVEDIAREFRAAITHRLSRFPATLAFYNRHCDAYMQRRLEKLNAKAEADAGTERSKASPASKRS